MIKRFLGLSLDHAELHLNVRMSAQLLVIRATEKSLKDMPAS